MDYSQIRIDAEQAFTSELSALFQMEVVTPLLKEATVEDSSSPYLSALRGHSFKVTEQLAPRIHGICEEVKGRLGFEEPIEFFIDSSQDLNAAAITRSNEKDPHIIVLNAGLLERFNDEEMRFIVGHELGHLVSRNSDLMRVIRFIFPNPDGIPTFFKDKIETWGKLSELSADRFGFLASPDLGICQSVFFKLSSGLDTDRIDFDTDAYQSSMDEILELFKTSGEMAATTHPINPIRLKALQYFSGSKLRKAVEAGKETEQDDKQLTEDVGELVKILVTKGTSPLSTHRKKFLASAGLIVAGADKSLSVDEVEQIVSVLAETVQFPRRFFDAMMENDDVSGVFVNSAAGIMQINPAERVPMFSYMINIAMADGSIRKEEVELLYKVGEDIFQLSKKEVAQSIAAAIHEKFIPSIFSSGRGAASSA